MEINELRIGNILNYGYGSIRQGVVTSISDSGVSVGRTKSVLCKSGFISPIPLTEEWLVKFGFIKTPNFKYKDKPTYHLNPYSYNTVLELDKHNTVGSDMSLCVGDNNMVYLLKSVCMDNEYIEEGIEIPYIHTLQNVGRFLTGKELIIKEE